MTAPLHRLFIPFLIGGMIITVCLIKCRLLRLLTPLKGSSNSLWSKWQVRSVTNRNPNPYQLSLAGHAMCRELRRPRRYSSDSI